MLKVHIATCVVEAYSPLDVDCEFWMKENKIKLSNWIFLAM